MNIPQKGWILVAIPLLSQLAFLSALYATREYQREVQVKALHTHRVLGQGEACHRQVVEAQAQQRGFLLTRNAAALRGYEKARDHLPEEFRKLEILVADNPDQQQIVRRIQALVAAFIDWMNQNIRLAEQGNIQEVLARLQPAAGRNYISELRDQMRAFLEEERRLDAARMEQQVAAARTQTALLVGGIGLAVVTSLALLIAFSRSISRRVATLIDNTKRLAEGRELAPPLDGTDELRRIDDVFHEMATSIRQKEQENELFVYSVSHDLRSPLVNLQGFSQELAMTVNDLKALIHGSDVPAHVKATAARLVDRDAAEAVRFIQTAVTRLSGIIDALLRLSRAGRVEFKSQDVDVEAVVGRIVASMNNSLTQRGGTIQVGPLAPCWGDARALDHIFANLIGNAINYLDPARPGVIEVGMLADEAAAGFHTYYVKDNGLGIPEKMQAKVFVAFQRLHPEVGPGEGIGLALVRRVADRLGGKVWLRSREGEGSTFYVALPTTSDARPSAIVVPRNDTTPPPAPPARPTQDSSSEWKTLAPGSKVNA